MRHHHARVVEVFETLQLRLEQPALDAAQHVHNILRAFAELGIVHRFQQAGVAFAEFFEEVLDVPALVLEPFFDVFVKGYVVEHHQMGVENLGVPGTQILRRLQQEAFEIDAHALDGLTKPVELRGLVLDLILRNVQAGEAEWQHGSYRYPRRYSNSAQRDLHVISFPRSRTLSVPAPPAWPDPHPGPAPLRSSGYPVPPRASTAP